MKEQWLYQIRIRVKGEVAKDLRNRTPSEIADKILAISLKHEMTPVCTYDAFCDYCREAEENDIKQYPLYDWTKATIENLEKKAKHIKSFAFYRDSDQVYEKSLALALHKDLVPLRENGNIEELSFIDSNPKNNPQPPKKN